MNAIKIVGRIVALSLFIVNPLGFATLWVIIFLAKMAVKSPRGALVLAMFVYGYLLNPLGIVALLVWRSLPSIYALIIRTVSR
jgi:hypothetical protein